MREVFFMPCGLIGKTPLFDSGITGSNPVRAIIWRCANVGELGWSVKPVLRLSRFESYHLHHKKRL